MINKLHGGNPKVCYHFLERVAIVENRASPLVLKDYEGLPGHSFLGIYTWLEILEFLETHSFHFYPEAASFP